MRFKYLVSLTNHVIFLFNKSVLVRTWFQLNSSHLFGSSSHHTLHPLGQTSLTLSESLKGKRLIGANGPRQIKPTGTWISPECSGASLQLSCFGQNDKILLVFTLACQPLCSRCHSAKKRPNPCCALIQVHRPRKAHEAVWQTNTRMHTHKPTRTFIKRSVGRVGRDRW